MLRIALFTLLVATTVFAAAPSFTNLSPVSPPTDRRSTGAAVRPDTLAETYLTFGGFSGGGNALVELVHYRSATNAWTAVTPTLPGRERHGLAYDPVHDVFVVAGGASGFTLYDTVFLINGTTFAQSAPPTPTTRPSARIDPLLQWIPQWGKFLYFGGRTSVFANNHVGDLWSLDVGDGGVTWAPVVAAGGPSARGAVCSGFDLITGKLFLFGGEAMSNVADTWVFDTDGGTWASLAVTGAVPSARSFAACAWDPILQQLVLYGGQTSTQVGGLFTFDPLTNVWSTYTVTPNPGTLSDAAAAYSKARGGTIIFAGNVGSTTYSHETWLVAFSKAPSVDAGPDVSVGENVLTSLSGSVVDPEMDPTTSTWLQTSGPMVTVSDAGALNASFTTPTVFVPTVLRFRLTGRDSASSTTDDVDVTVLNTINERPIADAGVDVGVAPGEVVQLSGSAVDPNGDAITAFSWSQTAGPGVTLSSSMVAAPTFTAPMLPLATVLQFQLVVNDGMILSNPDQVFITVAAFDGGVDAGVDAGTDAGFDAGVNAGEADAGTSDAGSAELDGGLIEQQRTFLVGCGCSQVDFSAIWLIALTLTLSRRDWERAISASRGRARPRS